MRKGKILGIASVAVGIIGLVAVACSPAPASSTRPADGQELPSEPVSNVGGELPSELPNTPEQVPMDEYNDVFIIARDDLSQRAEVEPTAITIKSVERVEWNDASLGNPEPDMFYAQVITPGFKMVLETEGKTYTYHTSANHAVFVEGGEVTIDNGLREDAAEIVRLTLEWALIEQNIPDYGLIADPTNVVLSTENINPIILPDLNGVNFILLSPDEIQQKADEEGDFLRLKFEKLEVSDSRATVSLNNTWAVGKDSEVGYLSGGGFEMEYTKESGEWVRDENILIWIS